MATEGELEALALVDTPADKLSGQGSGRHAICHTITITINLETQVETLADVKA